MTLIIKTTSVKLEAGTKKRIQMLGELNDTFKLAMGRRDLKTLRRLANQYQEIGCPRLASDVRRQARSC